MKKKIDVVPKCGRVLIFQHRDLLHSGDDVEDGVKYTMRTDIMYTIEKKEPGGVNVEFFTEPGLIDLDV
jgi:hypothetical protein